MGMPNQEAKTVAEALGENGSQVLGALSIFIVINERTSCQKYFENFVVSWVYKERQQHRFIRKEMQ